MILSLCLISSPSYAGYSNYNSVLLGSRAAGMGGAFTALTDDPSATPFYNPATTILTNGNSLSAAVNVYNKYNTTIGEPGNLLDAPQRLNQGFFRSLPSSSSTIIGFKSFSIGLSIIVPDYTFYSGQIKGSANTSSFVSEVDESLWVGSSFSARLTQDNSFGWSLYYTARNLSRTVNDRITSGASTTLTNEIKNLTSNSIVSVFGYHHRLSPTWSLGLSYRPPSLPIAGEATYYRSKTVTNNPTQDPAINRSNLRAITKIPAKFSVGFARESKGENTLSLDFQFYEGMAYQDLPELAEGTEDIRHRPVVNFAVGYEQRLKDWVTVRAGFFSNLSSHPELDSSRQVRQGDHIDMNGFSLNLNLKTHENTAFTFGGYYTGGSGNTSGLIGNQLTVVPETQQVFTMLIASSTVF